MLRFRTSAALLAVSTLASVSAHAPAHAQGLGNRAAPADDIIVTATASSRTAPSNAAIRRQLEAIPGAIGFVEADSFADEFTQSLGDALLFTPGVFADTSAQRENRISIRGSGLNAGFERRGLSVFRDGIPITRASGMTEFQEFDPVSIRLLEVYKGANGLRFGAASLGGAINIVSPTGLSVENPLSARLEGGSFNSWRANLQLGGTAGRGDYWAGLTRLKSDGFRDHSAADGWYGFANAGLELSDTVEARFFFTALQDKFQLAGSLSRDDALNDPRRAARPTMMDPGPVADDWDRNLTVIRLANRTVADLGAARLSAGGWYSWRGLDHAITRMAGIIDQSEDEIGAFAELAGNDADAPLQWLAGAQANSARTNARTFANNSGERGVLKNASIQWGANVSAYGQLDMRLLEGLHLIGGGQFIAARRDVDASFNAVSGRRTYQQLNPRLGLLYRPVEDVQVFANLNRSFEPPSLSDLTSGGSAPFAPLDPQSAWTGEIGARGQRGRIAFDVALYRSEVRNEFIDQLAANGRTSYTVNADRTVRQGIEAGIDLFLLQGAGSGGVDLTWRSVWTLNDFRFDGDAVHKDNRLAGIPRNVIASELRLDGAAGWYVGGSVRWVPQGPFVDYANTEKAPGYDLWGLTAGWTINPGLRLFGSVENLFDTRYISNVATTANQSLERAAAYTPGQGRALFVGASVGF